MNFSFCEAVRGTKTQQHGLRCAQQAQLSLEALQLRYIPEDWANTAHQTPVFHYKMVTVSHLNETTVESVALRVKQEMLIYRNWVEIFCVGIMNLFL